MATDIRMRIFLLLAALALAAPGLAADTYGEQRRLSLDAAGLAELRADVGAGSLTVTGDDDATGIEVEATLWVEDHPRDLDEVREALERHVEIRLERQGEAAVLVTRTRDPGRGYSLPHVDLVVRAPSGLDLRIVDRSGYIEVSGFAGTASIRDDSGSITLDRIGDDVAIRDDSGSIRVEKVNGDVYIRDGSGDILVRNVAGTLRVPEAGSGGLRYEDVKGGVELED